VLKPYYPLAVRFYLTAARFESRPHTVSSGQYVLWFLGPLPQVRQLAERETACETSEACVMGQNTANEPVDWLGSSSSFRSLSYDKSIACSTAGSPQSAI